jgi:hypothetical protein
MDFIKTTILDLIERANDKALVLPNFQRNYVWTSDQQRLLIASFIVNLPIGTFLTLEGRAGEFLSRQLCYKPVVTPSDSCYYLLDGQQRLSTVKSVFSDLFGYSGWESKFDDLFYHLRKRWYLDLNEENCKIAFGYNHLQFKQKLDPNSSNLTSYVSRMEPNELLDSIKFVQLFKKKKDHPFHPGRKFTTSSPDQWQKEIELSYLFSNDGLIPLYDFLSPNKNLVKTTLKQLAERRILELQNIVDQDQVNGYIISKEYLVKFLINIKIKTLKR